MTYNDSEVSITGGEPVELYEFRRGVDTWRFTSASSDISHGGFTYDKAQIEREEISNSPEINRSGLEVTVDNNNPVAHLFKLQPPGAVVSVTILRIHRGVADSVVVWVGRVLGCKWGTADASLQTESSSTSRKRLGLRRRYSLSCPHVLYGLGCNVSRLAFKTLGTVGAISENVITVGEASGQPDGYWNGGYIFWQAAAGEVDYRMVDTHVGSTLTLTFKVHGMSVGNTVDLFPGCNHTMDHCENRFGNILNYGGWPFQPEINPFDGTLIF